MTKKPKTRKAPAPKASAPKTGAQPPGEPKRESEIRTLVARWRCYACQRTAIFSDQEYQASTAFTEAESERLIAIHNGEQQKIECRLATLDPKSMGDVTCLLDFVLKFSDGYMIEGTKNRHAYEYQKQPSGHLAGGN
jgi:hypothetical protein